MYTNMINIDWYLHWWSYNWLYIYNYNIYRVITERYVVGLFQLIMFNVMVTTARGEVQSRWSKYWYSLIGCRGWWGSALPTDIRQKSLGGPDLWQMVYSSPLLTSLSALNHSIFRLQHCRLQALLVVVVEVPGVGPPAEHAPPVDMRCEVWDFFKY